MTTEHRPVMDLSRRDARPARAMRHAYRILLLCTIHFACSIWAQPRGSHLKLEHLTTNDGLSQSSITEILQDRRGFMWIATRDGLNRYDGNTFVVYKHNPNDPGSLSANFVLDLMEDDPGNLWIATNFGGVNKFDTATERFVRYRHDPNNSTVSAAIRLRPLPATAAVICGFGTGDSGLDKLEPSTGTFTHYLL